MGNYISQIGQKYRYSFILLKQLVITDFKLRYKGSALGYVWSVLKPLLLFVIMYFVFVNFLRIGEGVENWPVAMLLGIVMWTMFSEITNVGITSIVGRGDVIRKINFPKYVIVLSVSASALINLFINLMVIAVFMVVSGIEFTWMMLVAPLLILELYLFALGIAFMMSALFVRFRDVNYIWEVVMQALFYGSIVIYPAILIVESIGAEVAQALMLNPVAQVIQDLRFVLMSQETPTLYSLSVSVWIAAVPIAISVATFVLGLYYFRSKSPTFAEEV